MRLIAERKVVLSDVGVGVWCNSVVEEVQRTLESTLQHVKLVRLVEDPLGSWNTCAKLPGSL